MKFATNEDYGVCEALHRQFGTTYFHASRLFPPETRRHVHAVYGFVRVADEIVDNPTGSLDDTKRDLEDWSRQFECGLGGSCPSHPAMRAFLDTVNACEIPKMEPTLFLDAMASDLTIMRYPTYGDLERYMRGSAAAVGAMMCAVIGAPRDSVTVQSAHQLGNAMQLTNFLRDVGEDAERGRIYLPLEDLERFQVREADIIEGRMTLELRELLQFEIARARSMYQESHVGMKGLTGPSLRAVLLARVLYSRILDRIEDQDYDVFRQRARTSRAEKLLSTVRVLVSPQAVLTACDRISR